MRLVATGSNAPAAEDPDEPQMTPRGMAAPLSPRVARADGDVSRPATIRIEAAIRPGPHRRSDLERELDRAKTAVASEHGSYGQHLNWLLLWQGLLLNAFVILLVFGSGSALPGWRMLLGGLALAGAIFAGLADFAMRGGIGSVRTLWAARNHPDAASKHGSGLLAARALPAACIAGWIALSVYALSLPAPARVIEEARPASPSVTPAAPKDNLPTSTGRRPALNS
jgi:hypothetical protein